MNPRLLLASVALGAGLLVLIATPMGRPIYERMGFITPSEYRVLIGPT